MRVTYTPPTAAQFDAIFKLNKSVGAGLGDIRTFNSPVYYQQGGGLFSFIGNVIRKSLPFLKHILLPAAADVGRDMVHDYSNGISPKTSIKRRGVGLIKNIAKRAMGGGRKRKRGKVKFQHRKLKTIQSPCSRAPIFK